MGVCVRVCVRRFLVGGTKKVSCIESVCPFILTGLKASSVLSSFGTYLKFYVASVASAPKSTCTAACVNAFQVMKSAYFSGAFR